MGFEIIVQGLKQLIWGPIFTVISYCPTGLLYQIEKISGLMAYLSFSKRRKYINEELKKSLGRDWSPSAIKTSVKKTFRVFVASGFRLAYLGKMSRANIDRYVLLEGSEYLDSALAKGRGAVILNPHFGPFWLIMSGLGHRGYKVNQVALQGEPPWQRRKGLKKKVYDLKLRRIEGNMPVKFINVSGSTFAIREAIKSVKNNEIVLYPSTGRGGTSFHEVTLMRNRTLLPIAPFNIALHAGAALIPAFVICRGKETVVKFERCIDVEPGSNASELTEKYALILDSYIQKYPDHFMTYLYQVHETTKFGQPPFFLE